MRVYTQTYTVTVPDEASARAAAELLAARGHRFVAVRRQPEPDTGWNALSVLQEPPSEGPPVQPRDEIAAVAAIARLHGGSSTGSWGASPMTLRIFPQDGRVHEMTQEESEAIRAALPVSVVPEVVPPPGLRCRPAPKRGFRRADALFEAVAGGALTITAAVPALAELVATEGVPDRYAADALTLLLQMAVDSPGSAGAEVARVLPGLPAGRCELTDFLLGALAATVGATPPPGVGAIADSYPERGPAVELMRSPSSAGALAAALAARPDLADPREDPAAPVRPRALALLARLGVWELDHARETRAGISR
ncbi:hypothetical protein [Actinoplanes sp. NPDC048796]|uniref:hypothetical protein n=1 Tax=Actinoplanes sp. NPDC048796 TaxID=3155640 RepID=UPI0033DA9797